MRQRENEQADKAMPRVRDRLASAYAEIADITRAICATCDPPYHCCERAGCDQARSWAKHAYSVALAEGEGELPFLTETGCTVEPHLRPLCALFLCPDREPPLRYLELKMEIVRLEAERWR